MGILLDDTDFFCGADDDDDNLVDGAEEAVTPIDLREGLIVERLLLDGADFFCDGDDDGLNDGTAVAVIVDWGDAEFFSDGDEDDGLNDGAAVAVTMAPNTSIVPTIPL